MAIRSFLQLSIHFAESVERGEANPFLAKRLNRMYEEMGPEDRLRLMGIINHHNYLSPQGRAFYKSDLPHLLRMNEFVYQEHVLRERNELVTAFNENGITSPHPYESLRLYGCIPVFIALDLADEIREPKSAHTPQALPV